jgi:hypothetical protein
VASPDESRFLADLEVAEFQVGVEAGMWDLANVTWPYAVFRITAGDGRQLAMRLHLEDYPTVAPAGRPWDADANVVLPIPRWPVGGSADATFRRDWSPANQDAPYLATDRLGLTTHPSWVTDIPERAWNPSRTVAFYLAEIHRNLRASTIPE